MANSLSYDKITGSLCFQFTSLRRRDRSLLMEKQKSLESLKTAAMSGLCAGIRKESGRLSDVQSRINWVRMSALVVFTSRLQLGCTLATVMRRSGRSLLLTSLVALQTARTCSIESTGA